MDVRRAKINDVDEILSLLVQVNNVHSVNRPDIFIMNKTKYSKNELIKMIKDEKNLIFVAVDDEGHVLGHAFCVIQPHMNDNNLMKFSSLYVDDICVDENARKIKVGTKLFEHVKEYAKENDIYNITLNVWDKNEAAMSFYKKCGMHIQKYGMEIIV